MPKLGESVVEGTITSWLVKGGDTVKKYDPIAEVMTDKVNAEIPSSYTGTIKEIIVQEGETVAVDELICYIETEEVSTKQSKEKDNEKSPEIKSEKTEDNTSMKRRYSPAVLKLAAEHDVNLDDVEGTGMGG